MSLIIYDDRSGKLGVTAYCKLKTRFKRVAVLNEALTMLNWDSSVLMPSGGAAARTEQLAAVKITAHEILTDNELADLLDAAESEDITEPWEVANLREMRRSWVVANAVDADLVEAITRASSTCELVWRKARLDNDYALVMPYLEEVLHLTRTIASAKAMSFGCSQYEALLDQYEPGCKTAVIDLLFADIESFLPDFLETALLAQEQKGIGILPSGPFPVNEQRALCTALMKVLGFEFGSGRLDVSLHPFCGGVPGDIRITTRFSEDDFTKSLMGVLHETGHALYEMGLPEDWRYQPVGSARGMTLHESQSLLIEMQACRSREFMTFAAPLMREAFDRTGSEWDAENLHLVYSRVEPSFIRVDADEVTYPAHVILRYRLEKALICGDLTLSDLPSAWNDGIEGLLGIRPPDDRLGCLQDIHWYDGAWGYFPTYTMGALAAAQLFAAANEVLPEIPAAIARGDFSPLISWMKDNLHARASFASTDELIKTATGHPLETEAFKAHLRARYG